MLSAGFLRHVKLPGPQQALCQLETAPQDAGYDMD